MTLIIAEKKSLGESIASAIDGNAYAAKDYIKKGDYIVTWLSGHVLTLKDPEDYSEQYEDRRNINCLPIYFPDWDMKVSPSDNGLKESKVKLIGELLKQADMVIHAGDPDDEGQLLVDEVIRWHHYTGPVMRLATGNTTTVALKHALKNLTDNKTTENEGWAAYARSVADFTMGINLTRYFSTLNQTHLPFGRVKIPTLGMVIARDMLIENFQKMYYYEVYTQLEVNGKKICVKFIPDNSDANLTDGKIMEETYAQEIAQKLGKITNLQASVTRSQFETKPPLPFNLVKLQSFCSSNFGYSPSETLEITQSLRTKYAAITYNRTDCQYLSTEHFAEAPAVIATTMRNLGLKGNEDIDATRQSACFDDSKITVHFAIIPSGEAIDLSKLSEREKNVYTAICKQYLIQFMPAAKKEKTTITSNTPTLGAKSKLQASVTRVKNAGFLSLLKGEKDEQEAASEEEEATILLQVPNGDYNTAAKNTEVKEKETKPFPRYTKTTLNLDMTQIAKYVTDPYIKQLLKDKDKDRSGENGSIGTEATRAKIIDEIVDLGYVAEENGKLISTAKGRAFYDILPDEVKKADMTAHWWVIQEDIKLGKKKPSDLTESVLEVVNKIIQTEYPLIDKNAIFNTTPSNQTPIGKCPKCGGSIIEDEINGGGYGCVNYKNGCRYRIWKHAPKGSLFSKVTITRKMAKDLLEGKTVAVKKLYSAKKKTTFAGKITLAYKPEYENGASFDISFERESLGKCPQCGGDVIEGKTAFGCANYKDGCNFRIWKKGYGDSLFSRFEITPTMAKKLLIGETLETDKMYSKTKDKLFTASFALKPKNGEDGYELTPIFTSNGEVVGTCPRCGGNVVATGKTYECENRKTGCRYVIWKTANSGLLSKTSITLDMITRLMKGQQITISTLYSPQKDKIFPGFVMLDDSEASEYGPRIKITGFPQNKFAKKK